MLATPTRPWLGLGFRLTLLILAAATLHCDGDEDGDFFGEVRRLEANLTPLLVVDASGGARLDEGRGTASDRFDVDVEIHSSAFDTLGIDATDGFTDEGVTLRASDSNAVLFTDALRFAEDRRVGGVGEVTFELDLRGIEAPNLQDGDVVEVFVNGTPALRGTLRED